jgi:hypothetical protein
MSSVGEQSLNIDSGSNPKSKFLINDVSQKIFNIDEGDEVNMLFNQDKY